MSKNTSTANAANNTNTSNNTPATDKVEGTIVLSKLEKMDRAKQVKILFDKVNKGQKVTLKEKLELATYLLETKRELKNEFYTFITPKVMIRKQVGRHIQLILTQESVKNYTQGMSTKNKKADEIEKNLALLIEDTRVTSLTVEQIDKMPEPTMAAITRAKPAKTDEEFIKILEMDKKTLESIRKVKATISKEKKDIEAKVTKEKLAKLKPENMETEKYESLLSKDKSTIIAMLQANIDDLKTMENELIDLRKLAKEAKLYPAGSKPKSKAKTKTEEG